MNGTGRMFAAGVIVAVTGTVYLNLRTKNYIGRKPHASYRRQSL